MMNNLLIALVFSFVAVPAFSCTVMSTRDARLEFKSSRAAFNELYTQNDIVFFGKVNNSFEKPVYDYNGKALYTFPVFEVSTLDVYKGIDIASKVLYWEQTSCLSQISLKVEEYYFFIGNKGEDGEIYYVEVLEYLEYLGRGAFKDLGKPIYQYNVTSQSSR
ncbi:hypothetical protein [Pleionea litopenaei]|uniref:Lipoprotein n=1 Tax=Pleionea litopenaei TaxID=3070815 RepID=A0AA51RS28_9GAMM|nr:hypothetical protein [Pleionea sp. HL-JVS1]WMS86586.1 hypothetical protein Q9312_15300 [Pleionea sp. HL-JVS1]